MRMRWTTVVMAGFGLLGGTAAMAQQVAPVGAEKAAINEIVCTFSGKCAADADLPVPTKPAPRTRGFRLATASAVVQPSAPAGNSGYRAGAAAGVDLRRSARTARWLGASQRRYTAPTSRAVTPGAAVAAPRADLLLSFGYNSAVLTSAAEARARTFARALQVDALKDKRFLIEGHTDARGSRDLNMDLSRRRAQAVSDFLVTQGVDRTRVEVKGVGPDEPLPGRSAKAEANRRVEAVLLS